MPPNPYLFGAIRDVGEGLRANRQMQLQDEASQRQHESYIDSAVPQIWGSMMGQWDNAGASQAAKDRLMSQLGAEQERQAAALASQERMAAAARQAAMARAMAEDEMERARLSQAWKIAQEQNETHKAVADRQAKAHERAAARTSGRDYNAERLTRTFEGISNRIAKMMSDNAALARAWHTGQMSILNEGRPVPGVSEQDASVFSDLIRQRELLAPLVIPGYTSQGALQPPPVRKTAAASGTAMFGELDKQEE